MNYIDLSAVNKTIQDSQDPASSDIRLKNQSGLNVLPRELIIMIMMQLAEADFINLKKVCFKLNYIGKQLQKTSVFIDKWVFQHNIFALGHFFYSLACSNKESFRNGRLDPSNGITVDLWGRIIEISWGNCSGGSTNIVQKNSIMPVTKSKVVTMVYRIDKRLGCSYEIMIPQSLSENGLERLKQLNVYFLNNTVERRKNKKNLTPKL
jgi:hypothetical protein